MNNEQKELVSKIVYLFADYAKITDKRLINDKLNSLLELDIDSAVDNIIITISDLISKGILKRDDALSNIELLLKLHPDKYKSIDDCIKRLMWIRGMNLEHTSMSLIENHKLVVEVFDKFNELIGTKFDTYYTGGLMGYLAMNKKLERYHSDLDLFINEVQLLELKRLVDSSKEFEFVSNMDHKETNGHEYKIVYKGTPMSIGLFLFARDGDKIIKKSYRYRDNDLNKELLVDEHHLSHLYTDLYFSDDIREHNGIAYKMMSLEGIYNSKKNARVKDRYDASIIKGSVDSIKEAKLDEESKNNFDIIDKIEKNSIIKEIEKEMRNKRFTNRL